MTEDLDRRRLARALQRVAASDRDALADVYRLTSAKLFGVCLRILGEASEAEDVLQEVYLTVWRKAGAYAPERASPVTWLAAIARNRAIDRLRARSARPQAPVEAAAELPATEVGADVAMQASEELQQLQTCLGELEARHAAAVRTAFFGGLTYEALAVQEGVPLGTMKSWIRRALARLRSCLER